MIFANHVEEQTTMNPILRYLQLSTRESYQETKTPDGIGNEFDREIQRATISHETAAAAALPLEILSPDFANFCSPRTLGNIF
jgi:predicted 2-oxoglutarate/Fe(II)-dependent dioxygenase YbiX